MPPASADAAPEFGPEQIITRLPELFVEIGFRSWGLAKQKGRLRAGVPSKRNLVWLAGTTPWIQGCG